MPDGQTLEKKHGERHVAEETQQIGSSYPRECFSPSRQSRHLSSRPWNAFRSIRSVSRVSQALLAWKLSYGLVCPGPRVYDVDNRFYSTETARSRANGQTCLRICEQNGVSCYKAVSRWSQAGCSRRSLRDFTRKCAGAGQSKRPTPISLIIRILRQTDRRI